MSIDPKAKVRFLTTGPPRLQFASLRRKTGTPAAWNRLGACSLLLVWYQPKVPCTSLVPDLVTTLTKTEEFRPYSAEKLLTETRSSCTESAFGLKLTTPPRGLAFTDAPSTLKLLDSARWPLPLRLTPYSAEKMSPVACA